jgi:RNA polymerase sigma-70 factor (ECF subfamily)
MNYTGNGHDRDWAERLFAQYGQPLVRYAARVVGDAHRARDIVQDVFVQLCRVEPQSIAGHEAAWLYRACRNRALDVSRKERRMKPTAAVDTERDNQAESDPAVVAEQTDMAQHLLRLLAQLPTNQQEVVRLKIEHGLKYREIAEVTGLSASNVGYLLHQALQSLRAAVHTSQ